MALYTCILLQEMYIWVLNMWQTIIESQKVKRPFLIEMLQFMNILLCRQLNSANAILNILYFENSLFIQCPLLACIWSQTLLYFGGLLSYYTLVAKRTFSSVKPSISPSNVALNANQGTVLKTACSEDYKKVSKSNQNNFSYKKFSFHEIFIYFYQFTGIF